jgi:hypothetical protein
MSLTRVVAGAAAALTMVVLGVMASMLLARLADARRQARRARIARDLRPHILNFLTDDGAPPPPIDGTDPAARAILTEQLLSYGRMLRGAPRERISAWLSASGALDRARTLLDEGDGAERRTAALLLGTTGQDGDADALWRRLLDDPELHVRVAALQALGTLATPSALARFADLPEALPLPDMLVAEALRRVAAQDTAPLAAACVRGSEARRRICCLAAGILGATDDGRLRAALRLAAADGEPSAVRAAALQGLGAVGGAGEVDTVRAGLRSDDPVVVGGALRGAAAMRSPKLLGELAEILYSSHTDLAATARAYVACGGLRRDTAELVGAADVQAADVQAVA